MYDGPVWLDSENIAVVTTTIQSIDKDCVYFDCVEGERTVQIITNTGNTQNLALSAEPLKPWNKSIALMGNKQNLYYLSETPNTYLLHSYDITKGEDKVIFGSYQPINLISQ